MYSGRWEILYFAFILDFLDHELTNISKVYYIIMVGEVYIAEICQMSNTSAFSTIVARNLIEENLANGFPLRYSGRG